MNEIYISTDIETDGPIPGPNSMLNFGSAAFIPDIGYAKSKLISTFSINLKELEGAKPDPETAKFWAKNKTAWDKIRVDPVDPAYAMGKYSEWIRSLPGKPVFVAYPAGFDFMFIYWYLIRFTGHSPFSFSALDIKTFAMATYGLPYRESTKKNLREFMTNSPHNHTGLDDAIGQGEMFINLLRYSKR